MGHKHEHDDRGRCRARMVRARSRLLLRISTRRDQRQQVLATRQRALREGRGVVIQGSILNDIETSGGI